MIHGLSDQRQLIRGGKIKIGDKTQSKNGREIPRKLDYFRFVSTDPLLEEAFVRLYGEQPRSLPIMLPSNNREEVFPHEYRAWRSGGLWCHGDNQVAHRRNAQTGSITKMPCNDQCPFRFDRAAGKTDPKKHTCRPEGTLRVLLPDMPTMHVFELTAKKMAIVRINTCLDLIAESCGRIGFIPLVLSLVPVKVTIDNAAMTVYVFQLDMRLSLLEITQNQQRVPPLLETQNPPLLEQATPQITGRPDPTGTPQAPAVSAACASARTPSSSATSHSPTATPEFDRLYLACREQIELLPQPARNRLLKTLGNMRHAGDLKGFKAYLKGQTAKRATAA